MRRIAKFRKDDESQIDITPMLDVVFIMLIFFIVTASFVKESGTDVNKPVAKQGSQRPKATILVAVDENNEVWIDRRKVDPRAIKANIIRLRAENPEGEVVVQADEKSKTETVMKVVDGLRGAGITVPAIATKSE